MNNNDKTIYFADLPLRGEIELQSDPNISCFLIALAIVLGNNTFVKGDFTEGTYVDSFIYSLKESGFILGSNHNSVNISSDQDCFDCCFLDTYDILNFYKMVLILSKKGLVEIADNSDFVGLFKYMGYFTEIKNKNVVTLFNKTTEIKDSLTFHETNLTFFLVSILIFLLSHKKFSISIPEINYEISLLIDLFKENKLIEDVTYGNFVTIYFNFENVNNSELDLTVPKDSEEFIFWAFAAVATEGEIRINGLPSKTLATTLKILADVGAGFEALSESSVKVWGKLKDTNLYNNNLLELSKHLALTKLCLLSILSPSSVESELRIGIKADLFKSFILDLNRLGSNIKINNNEEVSVTGGKIKQGILYLDDSEEVNYAKLLFILGAKEKVGLKNLKGITFYNQSILKKLTDLGGKLT